MRPTRVVAGALLVSSVLPAPAAHADPPNVDFVDRLGCASGLTPIATGIGGGSTLQPGFVSTITTPTAQLSTQASGLPAVSVDFSASPAEGLYQRFDFTSPFSGAALDAQYTLGALEVVRPPAGASVSWDTLLPEPQRLFFSLLDFEYPAESAAIVGFRESTVVTPVVIPRAAPGDPGVIVAGRPDGSVLVTGGAGTAADFEASVTADVVFTEPVDRIRIEQINPTSEPGFTTVEYTTMFGCQGLDVVKDSSGPTTVAAVGGRRVFDVPFAIQVANTAGPEDMAVYAPQVNDSLVGLVAALTTEPPGTVEAINSVSVSGPAPACRPNGRFDGFVDTHMLVGAGILEPGERCDIRIEVRISFADFADPFSRTNDVLAAAAGLAIDRSTWSATIPATLHGDVASSTRVTFVGESATTTSSSTTTTVAVGGQPSSVAPATTVVPPNESTTTTGIATPAAGTNASPSPSSLPPPLGSLPATGSLGPAVSALALALVVFGAGLTIAGRHRRRPG